MSKSYRQGKYTVINYLKYEGDPTNVIYRSSWERILLNWLDLSANVISFSSEEVVIPYWDESSQKHRRYFMDFKAKFKQKDGSIKTYLIEVKPHSQTQPPRNSKNKRVLMEAVATYQTNQCKWNAAKKYCDERGWHFMIVTEYELGLKKRAGTH